MKIYYIKSVNLYFLYRAKEITKNKYITILWIQYRYNTKPSTILTNLKKKITDLHRLILNLSGKVNLIRSDKYIDLPNLIICYTCKNIKKPYRNNIFKI